MSRIAIRVDGDSGREIGMGHIYRSLAYARLLSEQLSDIEIKFFMCNFPEGIAEVKKEGHTPFFLPVHSRQADYEAAFNAYQPDLLIIDTAGSSPELMAASRGSARSVITLDDLEPSGCEADIIVNGIVWATRRLPEKIDSAKVYQGIEYLPLREQFAAANQCSRHIPSQVRELIISTGGADHRGFMIMLMNALQKLPFQCHVNVIVGPGCINTIEVKNTAKQISGCVRFSVLECVTNMADYLMAADIAVVTGGTVMFESVVCSAPAVVACSYEHQVPQAEWLHSQGAIANLGYFPEEIDASQVVHTVNELAEDILRRQNIAAIGRKLVDGRGIYRLLDIVKSRLNN